MFLKIKIRNEDINAQRFLWRHTDRNNPPDEYVISSMLFGTKSSPCTAIYIKNKNAELFSSQYPIAAKTLIENCYMDDHLDSCDSEEEVFTGVRQVIKINANADW